MLISVFVAYVMAARLSLPYQIKETSDASEDSVREHADLEMRDDCPVPCKSSRNGIDA